MSDRGRASRALAVTAAALLAALLSLGVRVASSVRIPASDDRGGADAWFATDPDGLYHVRRVARALVEGGAVAVRDPLLAFPEYEAAGGAPIPWPGAYDDALVLLARARLAVEERTPRRIEQLVCSVPTGCAAVTSGLVALTAGIVLGPAAAVAAGLSHALCFGSLRYSFWGQGDHHAWVSLWWTACLALCGGAWAALGRRGLAWPVAAAAAAGACAGVALASWVASLVLVVLLQAGCGIAAVSLPADDRRAFQAAVAAFHLALAGVVAPEVARSPWPAHEVLALSPFHLLEVLAVGAWAVAAPRVAGGGGASRRAWRVAASALVPALFLVAGPWGSGVRAGFAWVGASTTFMGSITESQPLAFGPVGGVGPLAKWLGVGVLLLPLVWPALVRRAAREGRRALAPWLFTLPFLVAMALVQRRFAEGASAAVAVVLGVAYALWVAPLAARVGRIAPVLLAAVCALASHPSVVWHAWERTRLGLDFVETETAARQRARRELLERLGSSGDPARSVLAEWDRGHSIEWAAGLPTVATNFGDYLGADAFLDSWRVLFSASDEEVQRVLSERRVGHVVVDADWARNAEAARRALGSSFGPDEGLFVRRLLPPGHPDRPPGLDAPGFLRCTDQARARLEGRDLGAVAWAFEVVPGAWIETPADAGVELVVRIDLADAEGRRFPFVAAARGGPDGKARVRVPYPAGGEEVAAGAVRALGPARWTLGVSHGELVVGERDVREGSTLVLPSPDSED